MTLIFDFAIVSVDQVCGNKDGAEGHCQTSFHKVGIISICCLCDDLADHHDQHLKSPNWGGWKNAQSRGGESRSNYGFTSNGGGPAQI